ncbi:hypothetical protein ACIBO6_06850 [Streptomyces luteogriseus]
MKEGSTQVSDLVDRVAAGQPHQVDNFKKISSPPDQDDSHPSS